MVAAMSEETVLVTGGTGFLASHCIAALVHAGYRVRTTVRDQRGIERVRDAARAAAIDDPTAVEVVQADLTDDAGWDEAAAGTAYVLHVASPYPARAPKDETELVIPAREGTLRVLRAARDSGVRRVVMTSSFAAIGYGHSVVDHPFTERDWTDPGAPGVQAYQRSKTVAERAAWNFMTDQGGALELAVVNPVGIVGPMLSEHPSTSMQLMAQLLNRGLPALPRVSYGVVDVRDVADLHLLAMTSPQAAGERFLATAGDALWVADVARILHDNLGDVGSRVPLRTMPDWLVRVLALVVPSVRPTVHDLGVFKHLDNQKAREVLGWQPRTATETLVATGTTLAEHGLVSHI